MSIQGPAEHPFDFKWADPDCGCHESISAKGRLDRLRAFSLAMAEDDGLWFEAQTAPEAYLQQELRRLMREIEE